MDSKHSSIAERLKRRDGQGRVTGAGSALAEPLEARFPDVFAVWVFNENLHHQFERILLWVLRAELIDEMMRATRCSAVVHVRLANLSAIAGLARRRGYGLCELEAVRVGLVTCKSEIISKGGCELQRSKPRRGKEMMLCRRTMLLQTVETVWNHLSRLSAGTRGKIARRA